MTGCLTLEGDVTIQLEIDDDMIERLQMISMNELSGDYEVSLLSFSCLEGEFSIEVSPSTVESAPCVEQSIRYSQTQVIVSFSFSDELCPSGTKHDDFQEYPMNIFQDLHRQAILSSGLCCSLVFLFRSSSVDDMSCH